MLKLALAALLIGAVSAVPPRSPPRSHYCPVLVYEDYYVGVTYKAVLLRDPSCRPSQVARVRKISTLNLFARYQPIRPEKGAWEIGAASYTVPGPALWTLYSWAWQFWDGETWQFAELR